MPDDQHFDAIEIRPAERQVLVGGQPAPLGARAFDLLMALYERRERVVGKNELLDLVWPGLVVEENNLQVQVSSLRKVLGPSAIATIPGRGYRFTLPLGAPARAARPSDASTGERGPEPGAGRAAHQPSCGDSADRAGRRSRRGGRADAPVPGRDDRRRRRHRQDAAGAGARGGRSARGPRRPLVGRARRRSTTPRRCLPPSPARWALQLPANRPAHDALVAALARQRLLLVLDNCEHLTEAVAPLIALLRAQAPGVRLLITSQESLKCVDEQVFRLGSLALPATADLEEASRHGAVALFVARAHAVDPRFRLGPDNVEAVIDICRRLDGIPLAIELAAARVPLLGVVGLQSRLDQMFNVLTGVARMKLRRHQTLRAALEWSVGLLSRRRAGGVPAARRLRRRLPAGARAGRRVRRAHRPVAGARRPRAADRQVAGDRRRGGRAALSPARADPCVRAGATGRGRRIGSDAAQARGGVVRLPGRGGRGALDGSRTPLASGCWPSSATCGPPSIGP